MSSCEPPPHPQVSVVICTRDRAGPLSRTLNAFSALRTAPTLAWEVIVIDNGSTDATGGVLEAFAPLLPLKRLFYQPSGQGGARNEGIRAASGDIIAWIDDDCIPDSEWLMALQSEFASDPALAGLGGRVELFNDDDLPLTIQRWPHRVEFGVSGQFGRDAVFTISGCNMAFRRDTFARVGLFDETLGPGTAAGSADDSDFLYRLLRNKLKLAYVPSILVYHNHGRRSAADGYRLQRSYAIGRGAFYCKHLLAGDAYILRLVWQELSVSAHRALAPLKAQLRWLVYMVRGALLRALA